jgi:Na+-transporting NADH:ubiquinone oxidoreductase subunit A
MTLHRIRRGLDLPITGAPRQDIEPGSRVLHRRAALIGDDFPGLKPKVLVAVGDTVHRGQPLMEDRSIPGVLHTAMGAGRVAAVNRGARRALQSVVIELSDAEQRGDPTPDELATFRTFRSGDPSTLEHSEIRGLLVESGQWTAFRTRPFSKVPRPDSTPDAIFVTAIDTNPLAGSPDVILADQMEDFDRGLHLVTRLTEGQGPTFLCLHRGSPIGGQVTAPVDTHEFDGPHPAGTAGVHIHLLMPVSRARTVWTIGYQDVAAIGRLFATGRLDVERVIAVGGPPVKEPCLVRSRIGAAVADLAAGRSEESSLRWISGSVLSGKATTDPAFGFLGRYHVQLSAIREDRTRQFMGWARPGLTTFSVIPVFLSRFLKRTSFDFTTTTNGSPRAMVPIGLYERVLPMDLIATYLLRALAVDDVERAEELGCLELDEEDLALCTFVDPGKVEYGPILRRNLDLIENEG